MILSPALLKSVSSPQADPANLNSIIVSLDKFGSALGLDQPHRVVQYIAQIAHESGGFAYDTEVWGPTPAQKRYDTRTNLGNTPEADGDGEFYKGRTGIMITGAANYKEYRDWGVKKGFNPPDFTVSPDLVNTDPWEGLAPIWYWDTRNLNKLADEGNNEMITKRINGGLNGYPDRLYRYDKLGLAVLGFKYTPESIKAFQTYAKTEGVYDGAVDGDTGPKTRSAIHRQLVKLGTMPAAHIAAAPVTEVVPVPVTPKNADKVALPRLGTAITAATPALVAFGGFDNTAKFILVSVALIASAAILWKGEAIARRVIAFRRELTGGADA